MRKLCAKRVLLAAAGSNSGKTMITCALLDMLKRRGYDPLSFKCGPDYIDPMFHKKILGIDSRNLDTFFSGREGVCSIMADCGDRYAVTEGVMGIYDGIRTDMLEGSAYETAQVTHTPIILIVDASGSGRTIISVIKGILLDDKDRLIKGLILNRISGSFYESIKPVLAEEIGNMREDVELLGSFAKNASIAVESRHLGLKLPDETEDIREKISAAAKELERGCDTDKILSIMESAEELELAYDGESPEPEKNGKGCTLAYAYDEAFCFYYRDNLEMFEKRGVRLKTFSPLHDEHIPDDADALLFGGGYPENFLAQLSENRSMLVSVKEAIDKGIPSLAECGGFMYLHKAISGINGESYRMVGVIDGECEYTGHLVRFGYLEIEDAAEGEAAENELCRALAGMKGHEFHYYDSSRNGEICVAKKPYRNNKWKCMISEKNGLWGFPHFYYPSAPAFADAFIERMKKEKQ